MDPRNRLDFAELYGAHRTSLFLFFVRRVGSADAEELVAQVLAEAWAGRGLFDPDRGDPVAWLYGIAHNGLRRHWRSAVRQQRAYAAVAAPSHDTLDEVAIVGRIDARVLARRVATALNTLAPIDREVLELCAAGHTNAEIAATLGLAAGTVKSRLSRARQRLGAHVGPD